MAIRLIYNSLKDLHATSSFDNAIVDIPKGNDLDIACPYLNVDYLKRITNLSKSWRLITDIHEWLGALTSLDKRKGAVSFMVKNSEFIRHISGLHAKVVLGEKSALIGSANLTISGITQRTEMGIVLEDETAIAELGSWFNTLWDKGFKLPNEDDLASFIETLPKGESPRFKKSKLFPKPESISHPLAKKTGLPSVRSSMHIELPTDPIPGPQYQIVDAILGAYKYNEEENWLSVTRQVELLWMAYNAQLTDGRNAFLGMHGGSEFGDPPPGKKAMHWTGDSRRNRMDNQVKKGLAVKGDGQNYMLAEGVTPDDLEVKQALVDALAAYKIIPHYDVNSSIHVPS